ncbi:MAG: winged helix-turn-helix transcriptional regulator [Anaerolineae bacterium]|nr:MAG: winged helix-turn-helix transcriptional regulator [Anaerolineae bacterium]
MSNVLLAPGMVSVRSALDPVYNNLASLYMIAVADAFPEVDDWVKQTAAGLSAGQMRTHRVLKTILYSAFEPDEEWPSFPAYVSHLAVQDPARMRNRFLKHMFPASGERVIRHDRLMDLETFIAQIDRSEFDGEIEDDLFAEAHALLSDPPAMRDTIVAHLTTLWREALAAEWERNQAFLEGVVEAFQRRDYAGQSAYDAIRSVTGRDAHGCWQDVLAPANTLVFIPSPHIGPYLLHYAYPPLVRVIFGAHLPAVATPRPAGLSRADILVQLRALADDTRLRILELLMAEGELSAQEIVTRLKLSKSGGSRHLSQLSATGFLVERQGPGKTKSYALNPARFREMQHFLEGYAQA